MSGCRLKVASCRLAAGAQDSARDHLEPATCNLQPATGDGAGWRRFGWAWFLAAALAVLGGALLYEFEPGRYAIYPVCLFHRATGLLCPGCGSLRALHQLLHGHLAAAFRLNALLVVGLLPAIWFAAVAGWRKARGQPVTFTVRPVWVWLVFGVMLAFAVWRNLPGFK